MPHLLSNIPFTIFYVPMFSELFGIARCALKLNDVIPRSSDILSRMMAQGGNRKTLIV